MLRSRTHKKRFNYYSFGMHLDSMLELPGLLPAPPISSPEVTICFGSVPEHLPHITERGKTFEISPDDCLLEVPGVGRYRISHGKEITIDPAPDSSMAEIRTVVCAAALGVLFHQRDLLPIHASAIETRAGCLAFLGPSHAGKSTLAAYLQARGYPMVTDDVCLLSITPGQEILAYPGLSCIRLWKDALARMGKSAWRYQRISEMIEKYHVPPDRITVQKNLPCIGIVQLGTPNSNTAVPFQRLHGLDAVEAIMDETFWGNFINKMGKTDRHFRAAARVASEIPIYRCNLQRTWERMDVFVEFIQGHFDAAIGK